MLQDGDTGDNDAALEPQAAVRASSMSGSSDPRTDAVNDLSSSARTSVSSGQSGAEDTWSIELAVDVLDAVSRSAVATSDALSRRAQSMKRSEQDAAAEAASVEQQQLAYIEHLHATIQALHSEVERYQQSSRIGSSTALGGDFSRGNEASTGSASKRSAVSSILMRSPLAARIATSRSRQNVVSAPASDRDQEWTNLLGRSTEQRVVQRLLPDLEPSQRELDAAAKSIATREGRIKEMLREKTHWEQEYRLMREQVVAEKMRQVELFHRLENHKREHATRCEHLERALRETKHENELLRSQLSEAHVKLSYQRNAMSELQRLAKEEKESLVCTIAETRHKFKEWKDGEASTLKAARDQAVHTLKTEYELKIARHHSEKQKLRDKVKDLEVSLRLLQKDRHLSPQELSLRKATILGSRDVGTTTEAELIEAHCRIKELEALLDHAKEYQKRQENIIRMSEATIAKLEQEREVVALEHATLLQPLTSLSSMDPAPPTPSTNGPKQLTRRPSKMSATNDGSYSRPSGTRLSAGSASMLTLSQSASTASFKPGAPDAEKELLRRQSIVLSAEVEKYRHLVVQSLNEIRTLRDNRRRSLFGPHGGSGTSANLVSAREQYLMNELFKVQKELDDMKEARKNNRGDRSDSSSDDSGESEADTDDDDENDAAETTRNGPRVKKADQSDECNYEQEAAVKIIQRRSKGFLVRRDFIKKKRAIDKIKAQYRGYLVRKNTELLDITHRPFVVTDAVQVKMQIVDAHLDLETLCGNKCVRLVLRVSKDPPVVQIVLHEPLPDSTESTKVYYFHLFEIVALLPMDDETTILEKSGPKDIAQTIGTLLQVVFVAGEFKFGINRECRRPLEGTTIPPVVAGSYLTPLHVQTPPRPRTPDGEAQDAVRSAVAAALVKERGVLEQSASVDKDLDTLIQLSRCPSNLKDVIIHSSTEPVADPEYGTIAAGTNGPAELAFTSRMVKRRSSSLGLAPIPEKI